MTAHGISFEEFDGGVFRQQQTQKMRVYGYSKPESIDSGSTGLVCIRQCCRSNRAAENAWVGHGRCASKFSPSRRECGVVVNQRRRHRGGERDTVARTVAVAD